MPKLGGSDSSNWIHHNHPAYQPMPAAVLSDSQLSNAVGFCAQALFRVSEGTPPSILFPCFQEPMSEGHYEEHKHRWISLLEYQAKGLVLRPLILLGGTQKIELLSPAICKKIQIDSGEGIRVMLEFRLPESVLRREDPVRYSYFLSLDLGSNISSANVFLVYPKDMIAVSEGFQANLIPMPMLREPYEPLGFVDGRDLRPKFNKSFTQLKDQRVLNLGARFYHERMDRLWNLSRTVWAAIFAGAAIGLLATDYKVLGLISLSVFSVIMWFLIRLVDYWRDFLRWCRKKKSPPLRIDPHLNRMCYLRRSLIKQENCGES